MARIMSITSMTTMTLSHDIGMDGRMKKVGVVGLMVLFSRE